MQNKWIIIAIILILGLVGVAYWSSQAGVNPGSSPQPTTTATTSIAVTPTPTTVKSFEVEGKPFEFSLKEIKVNQGDRVRITFKNTEGMHDWTIDEFNARTKQIQAGESDTVEFVADKKGTFEYYCSVGNGFHRKQGMVGKLVVE